MESACTTSTRRQATGPRSNPFGLSYRPAVDDIEIRFTEREVAQILWVLSEAADRAHEAHALSDVALIEDTLRMVRDRFDRRRPK